MKLSAILITYGVAMVVLPRSCIAVHSCGATQAAPAPRAAPVQLSSPKAEKSVIDFTQQLGQ
jgi:hypothetical protein